MSNAALISKLEAALASGQLTVESGGDRLTFHSFDELRKRIAYFRQQDAAASGVAPASSFGFSAAAFTRD